MKAPTLGCRVKEDLVRIAFIKEAKGIKENNEEFIREAVDFLKIVGRELNIHIGKTSAGVAKDRKFDKRPQVPNPDDISKLDIGDLPETC